MPDLNSVTITGNLTRDPELRTVGANGTSVCDLRVAVNGREKQGDQWVDRANYFDVTIWGRQGENAHTYLEKGRPVAITGELRWREWVAKDGSKRQAVSITAERVKFLGGGHNAQGASGDAGQPSAAAVGQAPAAQAPVGRPGSVQAPIAAPAAQSEMASALSGGSGNGGGGDGDDLPF